MDNSQSSDFLSESTDIFCNSPEDSVIVDTASYESLVLKTKASFSNSKIEIKKSTFSVYFSKLIEDCGTCVSQSLDLITQLLADTNIKQSKLKEYMNDAVCLLQLLSDLIKQVIETMSMSCCAMKSFPTATGRIIMLVFTHCKDSESIYGSQLNCVEKQLKDLFRTCHELQLTYLMVFEKHFIFDLTEREERDILIEALDINLKIGEIVESLDVKTMAEQWKAYTVICDKYSNCLMDKKIYSNCSKVLTAMVANNMKIAFEESQEEKVVIRSLKVSSFMLKILLRVCNTFRHAVMKDYTPIVELLLYIHVNNEAYLQTMRGKPVQFVTLVNTNVTAPTHLLLAELIMDDKLLQVIYNYNINEIRKDDKLLGLILVTLSVMKIVAQRSGDQTLQVPKHKLVNLVYSFLPYCHVWFNMGLKFKCEKTSRQYQTYGLYEHLLMHMVALAATMNNEEINMLEKKMLEALLSTECYSAMFSANLWVLLAKMTSRQYLLTQVITLCKIYQKLESNNRQFVDSPQRLHLTHTLARLFEIMQNEDKMKVYHMFSIKEERNISLWVCLKLSNLSNDTQLDSEMATMEKLQLEMQRLTTDEYCSNIYELIKLMHLASTCTIISRENDMENILLQLWAKSCPKNIVDIVKRIENATLWYYKYIEALIALTFSMEHVFHSSSNNLIKVLHIISSIVQTGCKELKLLLINILCKLANFEAYDVNKSAVDSLLTRAFSDLLQENDVTVKNKLFNMMRIHRSVRLDQIVSKIAKEDSSLRETWSCFIRHGRLKNEDNNMKEHLLSAMDYKYSHKCIEDSNLRDSGSVTMQKSLSNNFDLVDMDSLFDAESDTEPACKKAKLNTNEVEQIICRLETDASLLCKIKENIFTNEYLNRIKNVCNKLNNILE
ncbi:uncharacterized protein C1orf112 homolog [Spodoptera frugiperda]|uniref:Uncharacterized protein C1orf112 homolog n=1 Tax=Spodoptera frugiperda TaxID=7108 RepID=A0A9R0EHJ6_SPOFR|nr:uncharacterized protein C1orf112 homolog [Spodoptera frugiperda]